MLKKENCPPKTRAPNHRVPLSRTPPLHFYFSQQGAPFQNHPLHHPSSHTTIQDDTKDQTDQRCTPRSMEIYAYCAPQQQQKQQQKQQNEATRRQNCHLYLCFIISPTTTKDDAHHSIFSCLTHCKLLLIATFTTITTSLFPNNTRYADKRKPWLCLDLEELAPRRFAQPCLHRPLLATTWLA